MLQDATFRFWFESGHVALDLALSGGPDWRSRWERLFTPADLDAWLAEGPLAVPGTAAAAADLREAWRLREALWGIAQAHAVGDPWPAGALAQLNRSARRPALVATLTPDGLVWEAPTAARALATIARRAIELFGHEAGTVHRCQGERCWLLFVDTSPARRRRWCSMERCGNRAKVRKHRAGGGGADTRVGAGDAPC
jgi:predicted RNA-binding Zn ribbon-like protein